MKARATENRSCESCDSFSPCGSGAGVGRCSNRRVERVKNGRVAGEIRGYVLADEVCEGWRKAGQQ